MDPLSSQLACACVEGYAQRDYQKFALHLSKKTGRPVHVVFSETLAEGLKEADGKADIVIGKHSVILSASKKEKIELSPVFQLTDKQDSIEQTGLLVVRKNNTAQTLADLKGYRVLFGPPACDEKYAAPIQLFRDQGIEMPEPTDKDICSACSVAAKELMAAADSDKTVGVISSYALALLEGCGNIGKGDLRVIGETEPVPFISVFFSPSMLKDDSSLTKEAFTDVELDADLMSALESGSGFVPWQEAKASKDKADSGKEISKKKSQVGS